MRFTLIRGLRQRSLDGVRRARNVLALVRSELNVSFSRTISIVRIRNRPSELTQDSMTPDSTVLRVRTVLRTFGVDLRAFQAGGLEALSLPSRLGRTRLRKRLSCSYTIRVDGLGSRSRHSRLLDRILGRGLPFHRIGRQIRTLGTNDHSRSKSRRRPVLSRLSEALGLTGQTGTVLSGPRGHGQLRGLLDRVGTLLSSNGRCPDRNAKAGLKVQTRDRD